MRTLLLLLALISKLALGGGPEGYLPWPGYQHLYSKKGVTAVYVRSADGGISKVKLTDDDWGFDTEDGSALSADALAEVAKVYGDWISGPKAPTPAVKKQVEHSLTLARGERVQGTFKIQEWSTVAELLFDALEKIPATDYRHVDKIGRTVPAKMKEIRAGNVHLKVWRPNDPDYDTECFIKTWDNPNSLNGKYRKVIEGSGEFGRKLLNGLTKGSETWGAQQWSLSRGQLGEHSTELLIRIRPHGSTVLFHLETNDYDLPQGGDHLGDPEPRLMVTDEITDFTGRIVPSNFNPGPAGWAR